MIFLSAGLKYQDTTVRISNSNEGAISFMESADAICENTALPAARAFIISHRLNRYTLDLRELQFRSPPGYFAPFDNITNRLVAPHPSVEHAPQHGHEIVDIIINANNSL